MWHAVHGWGYGMNYATRQMIVFTIVCGVAFYVLFWALRGG